MLKKSTLVLSSVGLISLATVEAHHIAACDFEVGNCTGYFYEDINAAFVDCFDSNGALVNRKEAFYTQPLVKDCNSTDWTTFQTSLNGTNTMATNVNGTDTIAYCDYYLNNEGYQFTQANYGVGLVLLNDRVNGTLDNLYKNGGNMTVPTPVNGGLGWNWAELTQLLNELVNSQCNSTTNYTVPAVPTIPTNWLPANFDLSSLPLAQWSAYAQQNLNIASWGKVEWKQWISNYVVYWNALQAYVQLGEAVVSGVVSQVENVISNAEGTAAGYLNTYSGDISTVEGLIAQGASLVLQNVNITGTVNFTDIWSPSFDLESITIREVLADISIASNVVSQVEGFFTTFFVNGGVEAILGQNSTISIESGDMTTNISTGSSSGSNAVVINVPSGVEAVIAWITANFQSEVQSLFPQYNLTFSTGPSVVVEMNSTNSTNVTDSSNSTNATNGTDTFNSTNATNGTNSTVNGTNSTSNVTDNSTNSTNGTNSTSGNSTLNSTGSSSSPSSATYLWESNYQVPNGCAYTDSTNKSVRCSSGNSRGVTFSFSQIDEFWDFTAITSCSDAQTTLTNCQSNHVITDLNTCLRLSYFNTFQMAQDTYAYGWLSFDSVARTALFGRCQAESNGFSVS